jgi:hypothetical protein
VQEQLALAWRYRGLGVRGVADLTRLMTMSISDIVDRFFESEQVKTVDGAERSDRTWRGRTSPGPVRDGPTTRSATSEEDISAPGPHRSEAWGPSRRRWSPARGASVRRSAPRLRRPHPHLERCGPRRSPRLRREIAAPIVVAATHPKITFLRSSTNASCRRTSSRTSGAGGHGAAPSRSISRSIAHRCSPRTPSTAT